MKSHSIPVLMVLFIFSLGMHAQHKGSMYKTNLRIENCNVSYLKVYYDIGHFFGEPTVKGTLEWSAHGNTSIDCLKYSTTIWLKIESGSSHGWIKLNPDEIPESGEGKGYDMSRSPDWDELICGFTGTQKTNCMSAEGAKRLYQEGRITDFRINM